MASEKRYRLLSIAGQLQHKKLVVWRDIKVGSCLILVCQDQESYVIMHIYLNLGAHSKLAWWHEFWGSGVGITQNKMDTKCTAKLSQSRV